MKTVAGKMLDESTGLGYIRIGNFAENTGKEFQEQLTALEGQGMKGLILDLRENPGGLIKSCTEVANLVVPKGPIVSVVDKNGKTQEYDSDLEASKYPIVVLIDGNSASAAEILARSSARRATARAPCRSSSRCTTTTPSSSRLRNTTPRAAAASTAQASTPMSSSNFRKAQGATCSSKKQKKCCGEL